VTQETALPNAHDSAVDSKAQKDVVANEHFRPFIDKSKSIVNLTDVWATKKKRHGEVHAEPTQVERRLLDYAIRLEWPFPYEDSTRPK
jgi:hypothetical protein